MPFSSLPFLSAFLPAFLDGGPHRVVAFRSKEWQDLVSATALFLAPVPEEFLVHDGEAFLDAIIAAFDGANPPAEPVTP